MPPLQLELTLLGGDITMILLFLTGSMHKLLVILYATSLLSCLPTAVQLALQLTCHCYCLSLPRVCHHSIRCQSVATPASGCCCLSLTRQTGHNLETMNWKQLVESCSSLVLSITFRGSVYYVSDLSCWFEETTLSTVAALFLGLHSDPVFAEEGDPIEPRSNSDVQNADELMQRIDDGSVVSNVHTTKWRVFTDRGRDSFLKARSDYTTSSSLSHLLLLFCGFTLCEFWIEMDYFSSSVRESLMKLRDSSFQHCTRLNKVLEKKMHMLHHHAIISWVHCSSFFLYLYSLCECFMIIRLLINTLTCITKDILHGRTLYPIKWSSLTIANECCLLKTLFLLIRCCALHIT